MHRFVGLAIALSFATTAHATPQTLRGWAHYEQLCAACHGTDGDGRGPAAPFTRGDPRDFTHGAFEWRSTSFGAPPTDEDLRRTLGLGARGTSMPGFAGVLSAPEIDELVAVVRAFGPSARPSPAIALGAEPAASDAARGAKLWSTGSTLTPPAVSPVDLSNAKAAPPRKKFSPAA